VQGLRQPLLPRGWRRIWQAEERAPNGGARSRKDDRRAEERVLGGGRLDVGGIELVDSGVVVADGSDHGIRANQLDLHGDRQGDEEEEEVDGVLSSRPPRTARGVWCAFRIGLRAIQSGQ
jgi:hypothetical protein